MVEVDPTSVASVAAACVGVACGGLRVLGALIKVGRAVMPAPDDPFPPWQGMQYLHNMFEGRGVLAPLDNDRYPDIRWTPVRDVLAARVEGR